MKPPFTYFGGKTAIAEQIVDLLPTHDRYVEPFAGSLAVLLAKRPAHHETVNDLDGELMAFWRVLRDEPAELERVCALTPHSRVEHQQAYVPATDDLERARRVWVRLTQGRGGFTGRRTGWRSKSAAECASVPEYLDGYVRRLMPIAMRLKNVSLESRDALDVISAYGADPGNLVYADPPYLGSIRTSGNNYAVEMRTDDEHEALAEALNACKAAVVLSGYASPLYEELYGSWYRAEILTQTGNGGSDQDRTEVLWSNRPFPLMQADLFSGEEAS